MASRAVLARRFSSAMAEEVMELQNKQAASLWHPMTQQRAWNAKEARPPAPVVSSAGSRLQRMDGSTMLDMIAGLWCVNVGYGRREIADVAHAAMVELPYHAPTMGSPQQIELAAKIGELLGMEAQVYFSASGSEANEAAFKIARMYHALNRDDPAGALRYKIVSRQRAYHGNTAGAMAATGQAERKIGFGPQPPGYVKVPPPYPYRRNPKLTPEEHVDDVVRQLEDTIVYEGAETVAAFVMEPIISGGGVLVPTSSYLPKVRAVCDKYGVLLVLDEVVSGFGRTGAMFGHQHYGVKPDIITMAKGLTSGYMPLGATAVDAKIFRKFDGCDGVAVPPHLAHLRQINTYGGHPVACAVALKNIEIIENERLVDRAADVGDYFVKQLEEHLLPLPYVGEIRHKGLLVGVELVANKDTKEPLPETLSAKVPASCATDGIIVGRNGTTVPGLANVLIFAPPFVVEKPDCDLVVASLKNAILALP
ncbi:hypothetical protein CTAYLR_008628 [Chrysophaeum taylorii]|uniref:Aminotransferase n=1 Tax=Chrysophaeum taylorii TaxID=2483200 RepID=A0AAD7UIE3_9STRA|nr:hypothetical protein CTAYLR_008628 [Chrysophaeum taylorii]